MGNETGFNNLPITDLEAQRFEDFKCPQIDNMTILGAYSKPAVRSIIIALQKCTGDNCAT